MTISFGVQRTPKSAPKREEVVEERPAPGRTLLLGTDLDELQQVRKAEAQFVALRLGDSAARKKMIAFSKRLFFCCC